jgi:hypothetical protein
MSRLSSCAVVACLLAGCASDPGRPEAGARDCGCRAGGLRLSPVSADFGRHPIGQRFQPASFTLTNGGDEPTGTPVVALTGSDFAVTNNGCVRPIPAGGSCLIEVSFDPKMVGRRSAMLWVSASPGGAGSASLSGLVEPDPSAAAAGGGGGPSDGSDGGGPEDGGDDASGG